MSKQCECESSYDEHGDRICPNKVTGIWRVYGIRVPLCRDCSNTMIEHTFPTDRVFIGVTK